MTTVQENYQPLIDVIKSNEVDFVEQIQIILDYILISTLLEKNNVNILPLCNSTHMLIELRNAIKKCKIERL
jgi:hypothetical protein